MKAFLVIFSVIAWQIDANGHGLEEFGIYLNYVRKLGFEEAPDYEFLRELFSKVLKNSGDIDDGMFDWNLLNSKHYYIFCFDSSHT